MKPKAEILLCTEGFYVRTIQLRTQGVAGGRLRWQLVLSSLWLRQSIAGNDPHQLRKIKDRARQKAQKLK